MTMAMAGAGAPVGTKTLQISGEAQIKQLYQWYKSASRNMLEALVVI